MSTQLLASRSVPTSEVINIDSTGSELGSNPLPIGATAGGGTSGNVAAGACVASLAANATKTNYVTGFEVTGAGATGASNIIVTLTGLLGGTRSYIMTIPAGATVQVTPLIVPFTTPLPGSAINTAITVTTPSFGAGNTHSCANIHGFVK
jgi:hypothetical protein